MTKLAIAALLAGSAAAFTSSPAPKSTVALHETKVRFERPHFLSEVEVRNSRLLVLCSAPQSVFMHLGHCWGEREVHLVDAWLQL